MYLLYIVSSQILICKNIVKIGITTLHPNSRRSTYLTGCPPGLTPSHDLNYEIIFETTATSDKELRKIEDIVHNQFIQYRMMRNIPGDSEWFNFTDKDALAEIRKFLISRQNLIKQEIKLEDVPKESRYLCKNYTKNIRFEDSSSKRMTLLNEFQNGIIQKLNNFLQSETEKAGILISPCGSGKTVMTCKALNFFRSKRPDLKSIICVPSIQIQRDWKSTLLNFVSNDNILCIGSGGTTQIGDVERFLTKSFGPLFIITINMSSSLLLNYLSYIDIIIADEAHHLAGVVSKDDSGEGKTRKLMELASKLQIKRLSLTYTPRFIKDSEKSDKSNILSMDDENIFGKVIDNINIRFLIQKGILPDYRIWTLRDALSDKDNESDSTKILSKAECILEAWNAKEIVKNERNEYEEKFILDHLVIFTSDNINEGRMIYDYMISKLKSFDDTQIFHVKGGDDIEEINKKFTEAKRAIIVNCKVLGEGVNITSANAVAITYPKQSKVEITQMIFRAGRWKEDKPLFHFLLPILSEEDISGFEEVLTSLASCDSFIYDEIMGRSFRNGNSTPGFELCEDGSIKPMLIMIDEIESDNIVQIKDCFKNVRKNIFPIKNSKKIQQLCISRNIDSSKDYNTILRKEFPELPEDPRKDETWYDYLHPDQNKLSGEFFIKNVIEPNNLIPSDKYESWYSKEKNIPSLINISDGYFGNSLLSFMDIYSKFASKRFFLRR